MSIPSFRPVRAISPHLRDFVDAHTDGSEFVFRSAVLAHLAVQSGLWRVRQGENTWEQAGPDGQWAEIPKVVVDGVAWYSLDPGWRWRSVLPIPTPRPEEAAPLTIPQRPAAQPPVVAQPTTRSRSTDRPLLRAVETRTA